MVAHALHFHKIFAERTFNSITFSRLLTSFCNGPDQILPATSFKTSEPDGAVKLYRTPTGPASTKPISVYTRFKNINEKYPDHEALIVNRDEGVKIWTYSQYFEECHWAAKAMIKLGLDRFHGVCIMGFNAPEWFIANYGTIFAGGQTAGVYPTNSIGECKNIADNCRAQIIFVDDEVNLTKFLTIKKDLPKIKCIVQWLGVPKVAGVLSWSEFLEIGRKENDDELNLRLSLQAINQCCSLIYTSGTTGPSKGVMISQDHITWSAEQFSIMFKPTIGSTMLSYLPLSHIVAHIADIHGSLFNALAINFARPDALQGSLAQTLTDVQPHGFIGVPRVWEKYYEKLQELRAKNSKITNIVSSWAKKHGYNYSMAILDERKLSIYEKLNYSLAKFLVIDRIKKALGFSRVEYVITGTAPIDLAILEYFLSLNLPLQEAYGMSESLSFGAINRALPNDYRIGSVGKVLVQTEIILKPTDGSNDRSGEILMKGRNVMMGYLRLPEKTDETLDDNQWMHTGDLGRLDDDGYLYITGRIKELIITAGGENIPPVYIEESIKKELPCISKAVVIGDKKKYLTMLLTLKAEINQRTSEPLQELTPSCRKWMKSIKVHATTISEVIKSIKTEPQGPLVAAIDEGIDRYNKFHAISKAQRVQRWTILEHDFSLPTGELNSTLKLKREFVTEKYSKIIDAMYQDK